MASNPGQLIELPNGSALYYVERERDGKTWHEYYRAKPAKVGEGWSRSKRLTGVTTAIKPVDFDPGRLLAWAARTQLLGVAELVSSKIDDPNVQREDLRWLTSQESIWRELEHAELTFEDVRDRAGRRGTNVHELALRALAEGKPVPEFAELRDDEQGYARAVAEFWLDNEPEPLNVEQVVLHEKLGVAGRFDLRAKMQGNVVLLDAKTSGYVGHGAHVQLAAYDYLARECGIGGSDEQMALRLADDGGYELIPSEASHEDFLAALDVYRRVGRIRNAATAAWKERQGEF